MVDEEHAVNFLHWWRRRHASRTQDSEYVTVVSSDFFDSLLADEGEDEPMGTRFSDYVQQSKRLDSDASRARRQIFAEKYASEVPPLKDPGVAFSVQRAKIDMTDPEQDPCDIRGCLRPGVGTFTDTSGERVVICSHHVHLLFGRAPAPANVDLADLWHRAATELLHHGHHALADALFEIATAS